jgi:hypothetical protein
MAVNTRTRKTIVNMRKEKAMYYTCSMDPQIKEDKPGNVHLPYGINPMKRIICL